MNKRDTIRMYRKELQEVEVQEEITKQTLSSITRRKRTLTAALEKLGTSARPLKGKKALNGKQKTGLIASITS